MEQQHNTDARKQNGLSLWKRLVLITALLCSGLSFSIALQVPVTHAQSTVVQETKPHQDNKPHQQYRDSHDRDRHNRDRHDRDRHDRDRHNRDRHDRDRQHR